MNRYNHAIHKVFISFYHYDDQKYKDYIDTHFSGMIINKSVMNGEYNSENSDEYIKRLIREDKISDSSVIVVLIGKNTKNRKHVDWEIYAGLSDSINGSAGLVGIMLPTVRKDFYGKYNCNDMPQRFADNLRSGYASLYEWEYAIKHFSAIIEQAFQNRKIKRNLIRNTRIQMKYNRQGR
ncbi:MAG: TIR domain-containing protein [Oscillospiraceae bacterium]|nr:TIR domain-containing protein [Oscillospiraceae bacterium]